MRMLAQTHNPVAHLPRGANAYTDCILDIWDEASEAERERLTFDVIHTRAGLVLKSRNAKARGIRLTLNGAEEQALNSGRNAIERRMAPAATVVPDRDVYRTRGGFAYLTVRRLDHHFAEQQNFAADCEQASRAQARENGQRLFRALATARPATASGRLLLDQVRPGLMPDHAVRPGLDETQPGLRAAGGTAIDVSGLPGRNTTEQAIYYLRGRLPGFSEQGWETQVKIAGQWVAEGRLVGQQAYPTKPLGLPPGAIKPGGLPAGVVGGTPSKAGAIVR